jgi:hypothetical protein
VRLCAFHLREPPVCGGSITIYSETDEETGVQETQKLAQDLKPGRSTAKDSALGALD